VRHPTLALLGFLAAFGAREAHAYEDQATLSLDVGYAAVLANPDLPPHGAMVGLSGTWGLSDAFSIGARLAYAAHPGDPLLHVGIAGVEVVYLLDIVTVVPFFGLGTDAILTAADGGAGVDWGLHAVLGLDWLVSREWIVGVDIRPYVLPLSLADNGVDPVYLSVSLRASMVFDTF